MEEDSMEIDEETGTRIYDDAGKTVFANWAYVSPKETVTIKYSYILPFKINLDESSLTDTYSLLVQKQSGSLGSEFSSKITYPKKYKISWQYPAQDIANLGNLPFDREGIKIITDLVTDKFIGLAFSIN
jgi:hypothetical protein